MAIMPDSAHKRNNIYFCPKGNDSFAQAHKGQDSEKMSPDS